MEKKKIKLAMVFYGNKDQLAVNKKQFEDLETFLGGFQLSKYDFNKGEHSNLLRDFGEKKIDMVLKNAYGRGNEANVESFLELYKIPYLGSDSRTTFIGTSKLFSKHIFRLHGLPVAKDIFVDSFLWSTRKNEILEKIGKNIGYPCIIKDIAGTDSRGIYLVRDKKKLIVTLDDNIKKFRGMLVEEFIENCYETTCMVVGNEKPRAYEPVGYNFESAGFLSGKSKDAHAVRVEIPPKLSTGIIKKIKKIAEAAHLALGCKTFSRSDILVKKGKLYLLEVDVHPGFRSTSASVQSAKYQGESMNDLFLKFVKFSK